MLLSTYVSEHHNQQDQLHWQSCLNAIIADNQGKNQDQPRQDLSQLGKRVIFLEHVMSVYDHVPITKEVILFQFQWVVVHTS